MRKPPGTRRCEAGSAPRIIQNTVQFADSPNLTRLAEVERLIDAVDVLMLAPEHECDIVEYVLVMHGRARRLLNAAVVR